MLAKSVVVALGEVPSRRHQRKVLSPTCLSKSCSIVEGVMAIVVVVVIIVVSEREGLSLNGLTKPLLQLI